MPLTLERPDTDRLARALAMLTGETIEEAIANALRDRLAREQQRRDRDTVLARARQILRESGPSGTPAADDPTAFLYDERGLPV